jgi:hypothetical protein
MIQIFDIDFSDYTKCDYNVYYDCESYGCDSICRCGKIENEKITSVDIKSIVNLLLNSYYNKKDISAKRNYIVDSILGNIGREINYYTIDRILRINKIYEPDKWNIKIISGYYGEEIENIKLFNNIAKKIDKELQKAFEIVDLTKRIEYLLELEYGYILPELNGCKYELKDINREDIIIGNTQQYNKTSKESIDHYIEYDCIKCVVIQKGSKYRLIDGHHRFFTSSGDKLRTIVAMNDN